MKRILIGISGASGSIYGIRLLEVLHQMDDVETHLIMSHGAMSILQHETDHSVESVRLLADNVYDDDDMHAGPASGSFHLDGMCIVPCSVKTLAAVAQGYGNTLLSRAATCMLKENRTLILTIRETPLDYAALSNMVVARQAGAVILPAMPGFYHQPKSIDDLVDFMVDRIMDHVGVDDGGALRWG